MPLSPRTRRLLWLAALLTSVALLSVSLRHSAQLIGARADFRPRGWWSLDAAGSRRPAGEEVARQLSLPYAAGALPAESGTGVRALVRDRVQHGVNLYVSGHRAEAILMTMDGSALHRWRLPYEQAFPRRAATEDTAFFRRAALLPDGDLLAIYQAGGLVRLDADSRPRWTVAAAPYNDLWVSPTGSEILFLNKVAIERPDLRREGPILEDFVVALDGAGRERWRASLLSAFERSGYRQLLDPLGPTADVFHTNTIARLDGPRSLGGRAIPHGALLVSMREIDTVALLDPEGRSVLWAQRGPFRAQHEPSLLPDGRLLLFDNRGAPEGRSRIVALDPASGILETLWPPAGLDFFSAQVGSVAHLANGNLLLVESERGRALEVDAAGRVVWEFRSPHRAGAQDEFVATLFDVVRCPADIPFVAARLAALEAR